MTYKFWTKAKRRSTCKHCHRTLVQGDKVLKTSEMNFASSLCLTCAMSDLREERIRIEKLLEEVM